MIKKLHSIFDKIKGAIFEYSCYTSLQDMRFKMDRYIPLVVNDDLSKLKRLPLPIPKSYLASIYEDMKREYYNLSGNKDYENMERKNNEFDAMVRTVEILRSCGIVLTFKPDSEDVLKKLREYGLRFNNDNVISKIEAEIKVLKNRIKSMQEIAKVEQNVKQGGGEKVQTTDYLAIIARLHEKYGATIKMSVLEYVVAIKQHKDDIDRNNKELERIKNKR